MEEDLRRKGEDQKIWKRRGEKRRIVKDERAEDKREKERRKEEEGKEEKGWKKGERTDEIYKCK